MDKNRYKAVLFEESLRYDEQTTFLPVYQSGKDTTCSRNTGIRLCQSLFIVDVVRQERIWYVEDHISR